MKKHYLSTNILKAIAILLVILMHSLQYNKNVVYQDIYNSFGFELWVAQAVSIFVIVTGFHYTMSIENLENEINWYEKKIFIKKIMRILPAYSIIFVLYCLYTLIVRKGQIGTGYLFVYLSGGVGPGGYYTPILLQFLILFPIIYHLVKKYPIPGSLFVLGVNIFYEYAVFKGVFRASFHRLCSIRLLFGIVLGIIIYRGIDKLKKTVISHVLFAGGVYFYYIIIMEVIRRKSYRVGYVILLFACCIPRELFFGSFPERNF